MDGFSITKRVCWSCAICISVFLCIPVIGQQSYSTPIRGAQINRAYHKLLDASVFNFGGVGWGQQITSEERAFRTLLESSEANKLFQRLVNEANPEGQLYGLFGLHLRDTNAFHVELEKLETNSPLPGRLVNFIPVEKGKVRVARGCIFYQQERRAVIDQITKGEWDAAFNSGIAR